MPACWTQDILSFAGFLRMGAGRGEGWGVDISDIIPSVLFYFDEIFTSNQGQIFTFSAYGVGSLTTDQGG